MSMIEIHCTFFEFQPSGETYSQELCQSVTSLMTWADVHIVPSLKRDEQAEPTPLEVTNTFTGKRRRLPGSRRRKPHYDLAKDAVKVGSLTPGPE